MYFVKQKANPTCRKVGFVGFFGCITQILQKIQNDEFCQNFIKEKLLVEDNDVIKLSGQGLHMADFITSFILASISK